MSTLAIDIGGTKLAAGLVGDELTLLERREMPTPASRTAAALAAALEELVAPLPRAQSVLPWPQPGSSGTAP
nr:N-acetylmannosamine kinase [Raoultella sp. NCTC 9187]